MISRPSSEKTRQHEAPRDEPGWSDLLREVGDGLRQERAQLERHVDWRVLADAERTIAAEVTAEARRRLRDRVREYVREATGEEEAKEQEIVRLGVLFRIQHFGLLFSTLTLIVTGLPLRYAETSWARAFFALVGGVPVQAFAHRAAAGLLIAVALFHLWYVAFSREGRGELAALLPRARDVAHLIHNLAFFVGLTRRGPRFDRFSYVEKFDYWAVYWGIVVMVGSGLILWAPTISMRYLPKFAMDIAQAIHSDEALLAAVAIIVWHFYNVHFGPEHFPFNWAWLTGRVSVQKVKHYHPLEYERLLSAQEAPGQDEEQTTR